MPQRLATSLAVVAGAVWCVASVVGNWDYTVDDAFITFRYAEHLATGLGLTWNPGEPQEGFTSPLHVWLLACLRWFGLPLLAASKVVGSLALGAALVLTALMARRQGAELLTALAVVITGAAAHPHVLPVHAVAGLETALFMAAWAALGVLSTGPLGSVQLRALAFTSLVLGLTRPEGNLIAGATWAMLLISRRAERAALFKALALYVVPAMSWFAWRAAHFGNLLPLPFYVKVASGSGPRGVGVAADFLSALSRPVLTLAAVGLVHTLREQRARAAIVLVPWGLFSLAFLWPEHVMGFDFRFYAPALLVLLALAAVGVSLLLRLARERLWPRRAELVGVVVVLGWVCVVIPWRTPAEQERWSRARVAGYADGLARAHGRLGRALAEVHAAFGEEALLAMGDCGLAPFSSRWRTLDTFGLNDADIARLYPPRDDRYARLVFDRKPDVLVLISFERDVFRPHLAWEQLLLDEARARGFQALEPLAFAPEYHLWLLVSPAKPEGARALERALASVGD